MTPKHTRVLAYVNRIRKKLGKKPIKRLPKGDKLCYGSCPIARATGCDVHSTWMVNRNTLDETRLPSYIQDWIDRFDSGKHPELVRK